MISEIKKGLAGKPARIINLTVSGAHLYGFPSPDSDVDYRGTFQIHTAKLIGLHKPRDVFDLKHKNAEVCLFELAKGINLAVKGNCNVLEHFNAKQVISTAEFIRLRQLINNAWGKVGIYNSYKGMATFNYKKFILQGKNTVKKYLYVFRGLMAGIHALQTGRIEPNAETLNKYFKIPEVRKLVKLKRDGVEVSIVPDSLDAGNLEARINDLFDRIDKAFERSKIPDKPSDEDLNKINEFLVGIRKDYID